MAKRQIFKLDLTAMSEAINKIEKLEASSSKIVADSLEEVGDVVGMQTLKAIRDKPKLPAKGKYWTGITEKSVIIHPEANHYMTQVEIDMGFDYTKRGAGGRLITGRKPDPARGIGQMNASWALEDLFARKKFMSLMQSRLDKSIKRAVDKLLEGK